MRPVTLADVQAPKIPRLRTGIGELDRVLGGGLVPGSLVLLGGSPGIGKSTLTSMALGNLAGAGRRTLYVSGEESAAQIKLRAERLPGAALQVPVVAETDLDVVLATLEAERPEVCVIDSVQTLHAAELSGAAGSVGQVREVADRITRIAKSRDIAVLLVGHVTKEGALAGPRVLEHLVDCVLQFEGERERTYRTLRALKNRFGSTNEAGVFEMAGGGLVEVADASARFVGEATRAPGSVVLAAMEGSRPLLVEVQALVNPSEIIPPRRIANGIDRNRLALVLAVLGRHAGVGVGHRRRLRQRRGRRARRRAGGGPRRRARGGQRPARRRARRRRAPDRLLRRARPERRAALRRPSGPPRGGGAQVRPHAGRLARQRADACAPRCGRRSRRNRAPAPPESAILPGVRRALWLPLAAVLALALPASASACSCAKLPEAKRFRAADAAFTGTLLSRHALDPDPAAWRARATRSSTSTASSAATRAAGCSGPCGCGPCATRRPAACRRASASRSTSTASRGTGRAGSATSPPAARCEGPASSFTSRSQPPELALEQGFCPSSKAKGLLE